MLPTPAHDGVRLFLPTFFFLAAFAGWGTVWLADGLAPRRAGAGRACCARSWPCSCSARPPGSSVQVHPFELSYYNELIGGPRGAWQRGFELTYWYDAFNDRTLAELNDPTAPAAAPWSTSSTSGPNTPTFQELQSLGELRGDLVLATRDPDAFPYVWLLTQDSKASAFTRLLFAMKPWYALRPRQLDGLRVATVADPVAVSRAWALQLLPTARLSTPDGRTPPPGSAMRSVARPVLGRRADSVPPRTSTRRSSTGPGPIPPGLRAAARRARRRSRPGERPRRSQRLLAHPPPIRPAGRARRPVLRAAPRGPARRPWSRPSRS